MANNFYPMFPLPVGVEKEVERDRITGKPLTSFRLNKVEVQPVPPTGAENVTYDVLYSQHGRGGGEGQHYGTESWQDGSWSSGGGSSAAWVWLPEGGETDNLNLAVRDLGHSIGLDMLVEAEAAAGRIPEAYRRRSCLIAYGYVNGQLCLAKLLDAKAFTWSGWVKEETVMNAYDGRVWGWGIPDYPFK